MNTKQLSKILEESLKTRLEGLWANINAKKKRGEKSAAKGSKAYKAAKKAGDKLEKTKNESVAVNGVFKKGDKVKYLGHPAIITKVKEYRGRLFYSVSYNKGNGKTKATNILSTDGTITEGDLSEAREKFITKSGPYELFRTVRRGGMVTHIVKKKGIEWKQYPPNFKANVVLSNFKREFGRYGKTEAANILSTDGTITEGAISPGDAKKLSIGDTIKTQKNKYKITGYGSKSNAFRQFEAEDAKGNKYNIQVSLRGSSDVGVASGRSLRFSDEMVATIYRDRF